MKKIYLTIPLLLLGGCGSVNMKKITPFNQPSIATQKMDAQNAWDELDGKSVSLKPQHTSKLVSKPNKITPQATQVAKSMLEVSDSIPDWFYSVPKSNKYFYGAGEGMNTKQAEAAALDFIAREIQTTISSSLNINQGYSSGNGSNENFYKNVRNNIHTEVKKIQFSNIEIMKTLKVKNNIYILLRINKEKLFNSLKTKFNMLDAKIDNEIQVSKKYSLLDQLITLNKIEPMIANALSQASILNTLNPNFNVQSYASKYTKYLNNKNNILHKLTFGVISNDLFSQKLIEVLNNSGYKVTSHSNIKIKVLKNVRNSTTMGMAISRVTVNIEVIANNKILNSTSLEVKGISNNYSQALAKAANNFKEKLQEEGINKLLGFE